ncbi:hypothetical protein H112_04708 [Trichophyton rubrum D6]|uniref:Ig-like domain-containing protein n=3 Tax=Trichophyton TaxID=5550 RepID=F2SNG3_TRIRC|nr:uncharacterized protein TERG_04473 [Trichophyton rubrum CBS 118892]EZF22418.1 hypothetical protein H100_04716 [Trichophyton rubrum MR850]EZF41399.1 hypothetical protein H102_04704 [Trichophyton rubrum CBS 100081]EZF51974.1 hypothetical protein H103_04709 [Trichophyton rubrum CBS 288.86]EZF62630.1 hypothetical protein H104_04695 [Trichophyton rubrum CBS 289.86]EZF73253.1 hypothetical protein H105_04725 [Trichophyton soudanense CBS 452.61]EZF83878.1 hypothetical protein H110_04705 [Trichophy
MAGVLLRLLLELSLQLGTGCGAAYKLTTLHISATCFTLKRIYHYDMAPPNSCPALAWFREKGHATSFHFFVMELPLSPANRLLGRKESPQRLLSPNDAEVLTTTTEYSVYTC